jgi:hypothetical protein
MLQSWAAKLIQMGLFWGAAVIAQAASPCLPCHSRQVAGYEKTAMAHSLSATVQAPAGSFTHELSGTKFIIGPGAGAVRITITRDGLSATYPVHFVVGSGAHAYGYLSRVGDYLFQAPISYYTQRATWDMAPGYEADPAPDFGRPVSAECLECHAGRSRHVASTLNRYKSPPFSSETISCDRCHGDSTEHVRRPGRQNIVNPARLPARARDSICEQCHLSGEARVLNPGRQWSDFQPGQELEEVFSVYVREIPHGEPDASIKVISHVEQLALSRCARESGGKLWCATCHDAHNQPEQSVKHYRDRCLACHGEKLLKTHSEPSADCIACHMSRRHAKDGAHTMFTDHRIVRAPAAGSQQSAPVTKLVAWHEPRGALALRNLGLANIDVGERGRSAELVDEGARQVVEAMKSLPPDPVMLTKVGLALLRKSEASDATEVLELALQVDPDRAGSHVNLGTAYKESGLDDKAAAEFERAIELDPSLESAYRSLAEIHSRANNAEGVRKTLERYLKFMPNSITARKALLGAITH